MFGTKNVQKGKKYVSQKKIVVPAKVPRVMEKCGCRFRCEEQFSATKQAALFTSYYNFKDIFQQKAYITSLVTETDVFQERPRKNDLKKKNKSRFYSLPKGPENSRV